MNDHALNCGRREAKAESQPADSQKNGLRSPVNYLRLAVILTTLIAGGFSIGAFAFRLLWENGQRIEQRIDRVDQKIDRLLERS